MNLESESLIATMNTQDQSSLVTKESYEYYFRHIMTQPQRIKMLRDSADQLQSQLYTVEQQMDEHDKSMPEHDPANRTALRNRYNVLMAKRHNLLDHMRKIYLHLTSLDAG